MDRVLVGFYGYFFLFNLLSTPTNSKSSSCMSARISSWTFGEKYWETAARWTRVPMSSKFA